MHVIETLDGYGRVGWITLMVVSFILFWPVGLGVLAFLIWSGRMGNFGGDAWRNDMQREMKSWGCGAKRWARRTSQFRPTGNAAFDAYRDETLKKLEDEAEEFRSFLDRLREARDKAEFDQFMAERNRGGTEPTTAG